METKVIERHILDGSWNVKRETTEGRLIVPGLYLDDSILDGVNLSNMDFTDLSVLNVNANKSSCHGSSFEKSIVCMSWFDESDFSNSYFYDTRIMRLSASDIRANNVVFYECDLWHIGFSRFHFIGSCFSFCRIRDCDFSESKLLDATFKCTTFENCRFDGASLSGVDIEKCKFVNCSFEGVKRKDVYVLLSEFKHCSLDSE